MRRHGRRDGRSLTDADWYGWRRLPAVLRSRDRAGNRGERLGPGPGGVDVQRHMDLGEMPERGGLTVTVPGAVRLWEDAANRFGNKLWRVCSSRPGSSRRTATLSPRSSLAIGMSTKTYSVQTRPPPGLFCRKAGPLLRGDLLPGRPCGHDLGRRRTGRRRFLQRRDSGEHRTLHAAGRRLPLGREDLASTNRPSSSRSRPTTGASGLRDPTSWPGRRCPRDAKHPRRLRPGLHGTFERRPHPPRGRGQEARLRGSLHRDWGS